VIKSLKKKEKKFTVPFREVPYIALDKTFWDTLPQWLFLRDFQPSRAREGTP
jgi:hypothetical protein